MSTSVTWPGGATGATPTSYSIPAAGELNWAALSNFLNALGAGAQATTFQKFAIRKATTTPVTIALTDCAVGSALAAPGAVAVTLPAGANKQVYFLYDELGDAATNNVTITPNGGQTIMGAATYVINHNRGWVAIIYNSTDTDWKVIAQGSPLSSLVPADLPVITIAKGGTGQITANAGFNALSPMTTAGDIVYENATPIASRLPIGSAGNVLTVSGGLPVWAPPATSGTVTSVAATVPSLLSVSGSPVTGSGTLAITYSGTPLPLLNGGTGQTTKAPAFDALSPMTTAGDVIYGGVAGTGTRLAAGTTSQVFVGGSTPSWGNVPAAALPTATGAVNGAVTTFFPTVASSYFVRNTSYTVTTSDGYRTISCTAGGIMTITLPAASTVTGRILTIKNFTSGGSNQGSASTITITPNGGDLIEGASTNSLNAFRSYITLQSDGTNWAVLNCWDQITATALTATNVTTSNVFQNVTSISVPPGAWLATGRASFTLNTSTGFNQCAGAISTFTGNTTTDHVPGNNQFVNGVSGNANASVWIPNYVITIAAATTYYWKVNSQFSTGNPQVAGLIVLTRS